MSHHPLNYLALIYFFTVLVIPYAGYAEETSDKEPLWIKSILDKYPQKTAGQPHHESRVMFDEDIRWALSKKNTDQIISNLKKSGFNVYIPCIWHGKGARYPTTKAHMDSRLSHRVTEDHDPLRYLIDEAHKHNIQVHPWFTVVYSEDQKLSQFAEKGTPQNAYNIHNKEFRIFIVDLMLDVVTRYQVDGINLDYIRSMGYCTSLTCKNDYAKKYARDLQKDILSAETKKSRIPSLMSWNAEAVNDIVRSFSFQAKRIKPNLIISVDDMPNTRESDMQGRNGLNWINNGWVDIIFYMLYQYDFDLERIEVAMSKINGSGKIIPIVSLYDQDSFEERDPRLLERSIIASRKLWPGLAFYHYKQFTKGQADLLGNGVYATHATPHW